VAWVAVGHNQREVKMRRFQTGGFTLSSILFLLPFLGAPTCGAEVTFDDIIIEGDVNVNGTAEIDTGEDTDATTTDTGDTTTTDTAAPPCVPTGVIVFYDDVDDDCDGWLECDADADGFDGDGPDVADGPCDWADDCDDADAAINPGAEETCDGVDQDCDGSVDDAAVDIETWYFDGDGDGFGDTDIAIDACDMPADHVSFSGDCDDGDSDVHPEASEIDGNGIDDDCDGAIDECPIGESRMSFSYDTGDALDAVQSVSLQRYDTAGMQVFGGPLDGTMFNMPVGDYDSDGDGQPNYHTDISGSTATIHHWVCVDDAQTWYTSITFTDASGNTRFGCEGLVPNAVANGTISPEFDDVAGGATCVDNYEAGLDAAGNAMFPAGIGNGSEFRLSHE
jgi:hypothetical protein